MCGSTRPREVLGSGRQLCSNRVLLHVTYRRPQVVLIQRRAKVSSLPEMPLPALQPIDTLCMARVQRPESSFQRFRRRWDQHHVHMVIHQAVSKNLDAGPLGVFLKSIKVDPPIVVTEEHRGAAIASLRDMVWKTGTYNSREPGHCYRLSATARRAMRRINRVRAETAKAGKNSTEKVCVPFYMLRRYWPPTA